MKSSLIDELNSHLYSYQNKCITLVSPLLSCRPLYNSKNMLNVSFSHLKLKYVVHNESNFISRSILNATGFVFQNSSEPVPKCTCSLMPAFILRVPLIFSVFALSIDSAFLLLAAISYSDSKTMRSSPFFRCSEILASSSMKDGLVIRTI